MISIFILLVSSIAIIFLLLKLVKVKQQGRLLQTLRDLLIIMLAIVMTAVIFYIGFRALRGFI
ncbi:hypothetical protein OAH56_03865 [Gammaproteobacteria bacterium]|jgi:hypothetical protein|nr:hypothetical protein [Gammaproteobacteria bacterium]MDB4829385.1 hypothetical protein [Gammaproteobacteria bacterium]